ncbi:hypothetical protein BGZ95_005377 [Linnemannia exigua]|uniref:Uncharacterized protein n=1 Tax=Linnemannia exigua TaxID=604196 RepID=A0AAD4D205_9FUNG|nr:hypothetical protein BGZ95_005377 [Linnemannia exigua]
MAKKLPTDDTAHDDLDASATSDSEQETSSNKTTVHQAPGASKKHLTTDHYDFLLDWLEREGSYVKIFGAVGKTSLAKKDTQSSKLGFDEWAAHVSQARGGLVLTGSSLKSRFRRYLDKYKKIKDDEKLTGFGLTEEDYKEKVTTISRRYENQCPRFERMDRIFGTKANVIALASMEGGMGTRLEVRGMEVNLEQERDEDVETVIGHYDDSEDPTMATAAPVRAVLNLDDDEIVEEGPTQRTPAEEGRERKVPASTGQAKRPAKSSAGTVQDKRAKTETPRLALYTLNSGTSQSKSSFFVSAYLEGIKAKADFALTIEQNRLKWKKENLAKEAELRVNEQKATLEGKRMDLLAPLLKDGLADKELIDSVMKKKDY